MSVNLIPQPIGKLDVVTGRVSGVQTKQLEPNIGIPTPEFHKQIVGLIGKKVPLEKANQAIENHPEITDKERAKSMAAATYEIMGKG